MAKLALRELPEGCILPKDSAAATGPGCGGRSFWRKDFLSPVLVTKAADAGNSLGFVQFLLQT